MAIYGCESQWEGGAIVSLTCDLETGSICTEEGKRREMSARGRNVEFRLGGTRHSVVKSYILFHSGNKPRPMFCDIKDMCSNKSLDLVIFI